MATPPIFQMIKDIDARKVNFRVKVKVVKLDQKPGYGYDDGKPIYELIVVDEQGDKIGINIRNSLKGKFDGILKQWDNFIIANTSVVDNPPRYRSKHWSHDFKLMFTKRSTVMASPESEWTGPDGFTFIPYSVFINNELPVGVTADVLGRVSGYGPVKDFGTTGEVKSKYINLEITDLDGLQVAVTLWGQFCIDFEQHILAVDKNACVILLIQFGVTKDFSGKLAVSTDWKNSNVWIDSDQPQITQFRGRITEIHSSDNSTTSLAPSLSVPQSQDPHVWFKNATYLPLNKLNPNMIGLYIVQATINAILPDDTWSYIACQKCNRGARTISQSVDLTLDIDALLALERKCFNCGENPNVFLRFKVPVRVENETGTASFTLFESLVGKFITKSAYELQKFLTEDDDYPDELEALINKTLLFKIEVNGYNRDKGIKNYTVKDAKDDPQYLEIYYKFKDQHAKAIDVETDILSSKQTSSVNVQCASITSAVGSHTIDLTPPTGYTPPRKQVKQEPLTSPVSVQSSRTKAKKSIQLRKKP